MTGRRPHDTRHDIAAMRAITQGIPPASVSELEIPAFTREMITECWSTDPLKRPTIAECLGVLSRGKTTTHFIECCDGEAFAVAPQYHMTVEGWHAVFNPETRKIFDLEFLPQVSGIPLTW